VGGAREILFEVEDTGIGVTEDLTTVIPFKQAHRRAGGTDLGRTCWEALKKITVEW
jgi:signal transduction histidine kinase